MNQVIFTFFSLLLFLLRSPKTRFWRSPPSPRRLLSPALSLSYTLWLCSVQLCMLFMFIVISRCWIFSWLCCWLRLERRALPKVTRSTRSQTNCRRRSTESVAYTSSLNLTPLSAAEVSSAPGRPEKTRWHGWTVLSLASALLLGCLSLFLAQWKPFLTSWDVLPFIITMNLSSALLFPRCISPAVVSELSLVLVSRKYSNLCLCCLNEINNIVKGIIYAYITCDFCTVSNGCLFVLHIKIQNAT